MKAYTDLSQSKKLAKILPFESADMCYFHDGTAIKIDANPYTVCYSMWKDCVVKIIPCWSLAALIELLPSVYTLKPMIDLEENSIYYSGHNTLYTNGDTLIDACINMIFKLNEQNLI